MKLTKSKLKQIIKEELQQEVFGFGGPSLEGVKDKMEQLAKDLEELAPDIRDHSAAKAFLTLSRLLYTYSNVLLAEERAGDYLPALEAAAQAWSGRTPRPSAD
jgi:hypothetical protein